MFARLALASGGFVFGIVLAGLLAGCATESASDASPASPASTDASTDTTALYRDATATHLPTGALDGLSMDAAVADVDGDGDPDVVIANEFRPNILLLNDGTGRFDDASHRLPAAERDSEDVGLADFDGDGDLDIVVVSEDDQTNEYYRNAGDGTFEDVGDRWPVAGTSNAVAVADLTGDGAPDLVVGNNGQNALLVNDGTGGFVNETADRLPTREDVTQDVEFGDVDGDGDLDLLVGNEDDNRLLLNDGTGVFVDADGAFPMREAPEETREADFGDVDGDGDLDVFFANVALFVDGADPQNRLLLNDGTGAFTDATDRLPPDALHAFDGDLIDVDADGDLDVVVSQATRTRDGLGDARYAVLRNDGTGTFADGTADVFPAGAVGRGFDAEAVDVDGDGRLDLFLASRGSADRLLLQAP